MIPEIAAYGSLYGTEAMRELFSLPAFLRELAETEAALARAQSRIGLVPSTAAEAIGAAVRELFPGGHGGDVNGGDVAQSGENSSSIANGSNTAIDVAALIAGTERVGYPIVPLIAAIAQRAGSDAARYVHLGATTQDILDTARVLQVRRALALVQRDLQQIVDALARLAARHRDDVMAGRTHLQHALPITFGYKVAVWLEPLLESLVAYDAIAVRFSRVQFGGAVGTLASLGDRGRATVVAFAEELGLAAPGAPWHADRSGFAAVASELSITCGALAKIAFDITLLTQTEVGEVFEPHEAGRGGSSTMPQKRNPIGCEYAIACVRGVHAMLPLLLGSLIGDHERATGPWQTEEIALPQIFVLASGAFAQMKNVTAGLVVDTQRMRANLDLTRGLIMSEAVATALTGPLGKSAAHELVERACNQAIDHNLALIDVLSGDEVVATLLDRDGLAALLQPESSLGEAGAVVDRVLARHAALPQQRQAVSRIGSS